MKKNTNRGFTLIEIVLVLAIMGILFAIGVPTYRQFQPNLELSAVSREIASDLRHAQQLTVTEQITYAVQFNVSTNSYQVAKTDPISIIKNKNLGSAIRIQSVSEGLSNQTVSFNATGAALQEGTIVLVNQNGRTATIDIKPSGYVKIQN